MCGSRGDADAAAAVVGDGEGKKNNFQPEIKLRLPRRAVRATSTSQRGREGGRLHESARAPPSLCPPTSNFTLFPPPLPPPPPPPLAPQFQLGCGSEINTEAGAGLSGPLPISLRPLFAPLQPQQQREIEKKTQQAIFRETRRRGRSGSRT